jgi:hypothetical protein
MKPICILCGRKTEPAVMLADKAVGPRCARKAGLLERAKKRQGAVRLFEAVRRPADPMTLDLFEALA